MTNAFIVFFKAFWKGMKIFGGKVVDITNFILLLPVYILGVGLTSIVAKIFGKHFLNLKKPDKRAKTYWEDKKKKTPTMEDCYKEY